MLKLIAVSCPGMRSVALVGTDLIEELARLPVHEELALAPSLVLMVPTATGEYATLGLDAEIGPFLTKRHDRTFARRLRQNLWPFGESVQEVSQAVFEELRMANRFRAPPRIIPYYAQFYFPLGSAVHRDTTWVAGHFLADFTLVTPGQLRLVMKTGAGRGCTVELEVSKRLDAAKLSLLAAYAAEVTRRVQPLHQRYHARQMAGGVLGTATSVRSYAALNPAVSWAEMKPPEDVVIEEIRRHWPEVTDVLAEHASKVDSFLLQEDMLAIFDQRRYA